MMNWLQRLFAIRKAFFREANKPQELHRESPELRQLRELDAFLRSLPEADHYIAGSEYRPRLQEAAGLADWFRVLQDSGTLEDFCRKSSASAEEIRGTLARYHSYYTLIEERNEQYIRTKMETERDYLDHILDACDPHIRLDDDQRRAVLTDEDYCLVVAGAGAGKTTTVAAKVKYLVEKQDVDPKDILVISFTNKAVNELKQRITGEMHIGCPICTFHSAGNAVLHIHNPEKRNIVDGSKAYYVVRDYLRTSVMQNESTVNSLILFFASYFDAPYEGADLNTFFNHIARTSYTTMRSELDDFRQQVIDTRTRKMVTIQNEVLRSAQEVEIANFLYLNGIDYEYEPIYPYHIQFARKPYTPDFLLRQGEHSAYLEHFGITEDGRNDRYTEAQAAAYRQAVNDKIRLHRAHGTTLLYTFSAYNDGKSLEAHLREQLEANGFVLKPRSNQEVLAKLTASEENRYIRKLVSLITRFITNFKTNGYTLEDFSRMYHSTQNVRSRLFLDICQDCYLEYERWLKENRAVDFQDMINESARLLREAKEMQTRLHFRYIIVDEYQDISRQRFDLVSALRSVTDAKIIAVGDDWQSIYAFSGSDITLFTKFAEKMGYAKLLKIVRTYRNSQEVIDIAGHFIQKNEQQIAKELISRKHLTDPVIIYTYDSRAKDPKGDNRSGVNYAIAHAVETALDQIIAYSRTENGMSPGGKSVRTEKDMSTGGAASPAGSHVAADRRPAVPNPGTILLLGRFGFDGDLLERSGLFEYTARGSRLRSVKYPRLDITFMTAHASKGLGYDNVIVVNGRNETYGFPSKIEDDPVLAFVIREDHAIDYAEERRLFYVAMTRTKNRVYFIAPEENPSEFLLEIKRDYKNVSLKGRWNDDPKMLPSFRKSCPMCGYPMQLRYKAAYGLRLYICTNEPEVCGFMTNEYRAGKLGILKCDQCRDGYLIVKKSRGSSSYMLGCTNYKKDGTGCSRAMSPKYYYQYMNIQEEMPEKPSQYTDRLAGKSAGKVKNIQSDSIQPEEKSKESVLPGEKSRERVQPEEKSQASPQPDSVQLEEISRAGTQPENTRQESKQSEIVQQENRQQENRQQENRQQENRQQENRQQENRQQENRQHANRQREHTQLGNIQRENTRQESKQPENIPEEIVQPADIREETDPQKALMDNPVLWQGHDLNRLLSDILHCLSDISAGHFYGMEVFLAVLRGEENKHMVRTGLTRAAGYGSCRDISREDLTFLLSWLIGKEYIRETKGRWPVLHPTWNGIHYEEIMTRRQLLALKRKLEQNQNNFSEIL